MVKLLLRHGANVRLISTGEHLAALNGATANCNYATAMALMEAGANPAHITKVPKNM